jgi:hypothetical protein
MKTLKSYVLIIASFLMFCTLIGHARGQTTTQISKKRFVAFGYCSDKVITVLHRDTIRDTTIVYAPCPQDSVKPPITDKDTLYRGLYLNGFAGIVGNKAKEEALIFDLKRWKINATHAYDLSKILGVKNAELADLHKRLRRDAGIKEIIAARGNSSSALGAATTFNKAYPDSSDFDGWNLEFEAYNAYPKIGGGYTFDKSKADLLTYPENATAAQKAAIDTENEKRKETARTLAWADNKRYLNEMKAGKANGQVDYSVQYFGWYKTPFVTDAPKEVVELTDYAIVHQYEKKPGFSYTRSRCNELNNQAKIAGKKIIVRPLFSAEPDFMQDWYEKNPLDLAFTIWHEGFKAEKYSHLVSDGYIIFALDFLRVATQVVPLARMTEGSEQPLPDFVDEEFQNTTTERSLMNSTEPE